MQRKINVIDFKTVLTKEDIRALTEEERTIAVKEGLFNAHYLRSLYGQDGLHDLITFRSREIAFVNSKYQNLTPQAKELLAATIAFPDDDAFIRCLLSRNITYIKLHNYARAISGLKKISEKDKKPDDNIREAINKITILCSLVRMHFGITDYNLILAKINEIIEFKKDLYKKLEQEQFKTSPKTR